MYVALRGYAAKACITADGDAILRVGISPKSSFTGTDSWQFPVHANPRERRVDNLIALTKAIDFLPSRKCGALRFNIRSNRLTRASVDYAMRRIMGAIDIIREAERLNMLESAQRMKISAMSVISSGNKAENA